MEKVGLKSKVSKLYIACMPIIVKKKCISLEAGVDKFALTQS